MFKNKKMCRSCLTAERELLPISASVETEKRIVDYFKFYLNFPISEGDELPQTICLKCFDKLLEVKKFYLQCKDSEDYLRNKLENCMQAIIEEESNSNDRLEVMMIERYSESQPDEDTYSSEDIIDYEPLETVTLDETPVPTEEFKCNMCDETFKYEKNLKMHVKVFHDCDETDHIVSEIIEQFPNDSPVTEPEETKERREDPFRCDRCDCTFRFKRNYQNHMRRHSSEPKYKCPQCNKTFFSETSMQKHYRTVHVVPGIDESCLCPMCGVQLSSKKNLDVHLETHNENRKKYCCEFCDKSFFRKDSLICHVRTHTGERPFQCEICHKRFTQKNALATHMTLHTGKTVKCPLCDKTFSRPSFLKVHNREHTDERPYACDMCPKRYRQMTHLRAHQYIHFDAKPFSCDICGKSYSQKSTLSQHLFVHIGRPYKCPACTMTFIRPYRFRQHLVNTHNIYDDPQNFKTNSTNQEDVTEEEMLEANFLEYKTEFEDDNNTTEEIEIDIANL